VEKTIASHNLMEISTAEYIQNTIKFKNRDQPAYEFLEEIINASDRRQKQVMNISGRSTSK
jgi:hypothetical protein